MTNKLKRLITSLYPYNQRGYKHFSAIEKKSEIESKSLTSSDFSSLNSGIDPHSPIRSSDLFRIRSNLSRLIRSESYHSINRTEQKREDEGDEDDDDKRFLMNNAAVLIGLCNFCNDDGRILPGLILTVRSKLLKSHPGGKEDVKTDLSLLMTSLRETYEEIGLLPNHQLEYLGSLDPIFNKKQSINIYPFVTFVHPTDKLMNERDFSSGLIFKPRQMSPLNYSQPIPSLTFTTTKPLSQIENLQIRTGGDYCEIQSYESREILLSEEVDYVFQISLIDLLDPERMIERNRFYRRNAPREYLEWDLRPETEGFREFLRSETKVNLKSFVGVEEDQADHISNGGVAYGMRNRNGTMEYDDDSAKQLRLWGISAWIIQLSSLAYSYSLFFNFLTLYLTSNPSN
ncbi:hypothetical protein PPACK8108_LOCUS19143 [Phakopsora pachyrhizi]|uniref:Nudix hydrolase domain-containing protein n=1 Tax=Phakopsora pachyrhizi TaxID=170000 RepID=A0AAV0BFB6_PHAPC|nr:hypothetical protein PPACK8108_LOCUS19143 [Phakopsora pachyrhizi]